MNMSRVSVYCRVRTASNGTLNDNTLLRVSNEKVYITSDSKSTAHSKVSRQTQHRNQQGESYHHNNSNISSINSYMDKTSTQNDDKDVENFSPRQEYTFDEVFTDSSNNSHVFAQTTAQVIKEAILNGISATVMSYGEHNSGKTHTMFGNVAQLQRQHTLPVSVPLSASRTTSSHALPQLSERTNVHSSHNNHEEEWLNSVNSGNYKSSNVNNDLGLAQRSILYLFQLIAQTKHECSYEVSVSFVQLLGEEVIDLLSTSSSFLYSDVQDFKTNEKNNVVMQRPMITLDDKGQVCLKNIEEVKCTNAEMALDALQRGLVNGKRRQQLKSNTKSALLWSPEQIKHKSRDQHITSSANHNLTNNNNNYYNNEDKCKNKVKCKTTCPEELLLLLLPCHYIFSIHVKSQMLQESDAQWKSATLHCVDLASPQRLDKINEWMNSSSMQSNSELRRIAQLTNRSLSTLEQVLRRLAMSDNFSKNSSVGSIRFAHNGKSTKHDNNNSFQLLDTQFSDSNSVMYYDHYDNDNDDDDDEEGDAATFESGNDTIHSVYNKNDNKRMHNVNSYVKKDVTTLSNMHQHEQYKSLSHVKEQSSLPSSLSFASHAHKVKTNHKVVSSPIPYRQSKLTLLLKDSLSGSCVNVIIAHITVPSQHDHRALEGVMSTLNFARRAQRITINPTTHIIKDAHAQVKELERQVKDLKTELRLQGQLIRQKHEEEDKNEVQELQGRKGSGSNYTDEEVNNAQSGKSERNKRQQTTKNAHLINSTNNKRPPLATKTTSSSSSPVHNTTTTDNKNDNKNESNTNCVSADSKVEMTNRLRNFLQGKSVSLRLGSVAEMNYCFGELRNMLEDKEEIINKLEREHAELIRLAAEIEATEKRNKLSCGNVSSTHSSSSSSNTNSAPGSRLNRERRASVNSNLPPSPLSMSSGYNALSTAPLTASEMLSSKLSMILKGKEEVHVSPSVLDSSTGVGYGMSKKASPMLHSGKEMKQPPLNNTNSFNVNKTSLLHEVNGTISMSNDMQSEDECRPRSAHVTHKYNNVPTTTTTTIITNSNICDSSDGNSQSTSLPLQQVKEKFHTLPPVRPHSAQIIQTVNVPTFNRPCTSSLARPHTMPTSMSTSNRNSSMDVNHKIASLHSFTAEERHLMMEMRKVIITAKMKSSRSTIQIIEEDTELQNTLRHMAFEVYKTTKAGTLQTRVICEQQALVDERAIELNQLHRKANMLRFEHERRPMSATMNNIINNMSIKEEVQQGEKIHKYNKLQEEIPQKQQEEYEKKQHNNTNHESSSSCKDKMHGNRPQTAISAFHGELVSRRAISSQPASNTAAAAAHTGIGSVFSSTWNGPLHCNLPYEELPITELTLTNNMEKVSAHGWNSNPSERLTSAHNQHTIWLQSQINFIQTRIDAVNTESKQLQQELVRRQRLLLVNFDEWYRHVFQTLLQILTITEQQEQEQQNAELFLSRLTSTQINMSNADQYTTNQSSTAVIN